MSDLLIRHVEMKDADGIVAIRKQETVAQNTLGLPYQSVKRTEQFLSRALEDATGYILVAEKGETIVGICSIKVFDNPKMNHAATLGIMVHEAYHGQGIGNALMTEILKLSDDWLMLKRIELGVLSDNEKAMKLYEKHGFEKEGLKKYSIKKNGVFADEVIMARYR
ncbi:GNAT family N-acetyltransferase [Fusibacter ferrireducens]|uniref:GNAT family N-acetyltransferase n=1 Tax=Fusibacter ferrireducens TaxID=2785058 RepID=A0ABR9ZQS7_9FIRM|nr:GNAT family N-acetyltransferase [Fusibacter ferrireducens]MBF4692801.1 GNAT family N-acetyltransferase [Fusibacter ferrireducens]